MQDENEQSLQYRTVITSDSPFYHETFTLQKSYST